MNHSSKILLCTLMMPLFLLATLACTDRETAVPDREGMASDPVMGLIVADTVTYDVVITNTDPENTWEEERLRLLDHKALIDNIFYMISTGTASASHYATNEPLTMSQLRDIENEPGYDRGQIGKIQFTEIWYLNPDNGEMTKKVHSMVLGYNYYTSDGALFGHTPLFRINLGVRE